MTLIEAIRQATAHWSHPDTLDWTYTLSVWDGEMPNPTCRITVFPGDRPGTVAIATSWADGDVIRTAGESLITDALAAMGRLRSWAEPMGMPGELAAALTEAARLMEVGP